MLKLMPMHVMPFGDKSTGIVGAAGKILMPIQSASIAINSQGSTSGEHKKHFRLKKVDRSAIKEKEKEEAQ